MHKIQYNDPAPSDTTEEIFWGNLEIADKTHNLSLFSAVSQSWYKMNPTKNCQDFEKVLRDKEFNTHLFINNEQVRTGARLVHPVFDQIAKYECFYSCRPAEMARQEVEETVGSYDNNFKLLAEAGHLQIDEGEFSPTQDDVVLNKEERDDLALLSQNKKKLSLVKVSANTILNEIIADVKSKGGSPQMKVLGMDGEYMVSGVFVDDQLVAPLGFLINGQKQVVKVVNL